MRDAVAGRDESEASRDALEARPMPLLFQPAHLFDKLRPEGGPSTYSVTLTSGVTHGEVLKAGTLFERTSLIVSIG